MVTFSGAVGGGGAFVVCVVCVGDGRWVGLCDGVFVWVGDGVDDGETDGVELDAFDVDEVSITIGTTISKPTTRNAAAMAILESCIGSSGGEGTLDFDLGPYSADYPGAAGA